MSTILIKNIGSLFSGKVDQAVLNADSILIEDGKIKEVGKGLSGAADTVVIDARGTTVMPGLLDSHTHPVIGSYTPRQTAMNWIEPYIKAGVTGLVSVGEPHTPGKGKLNHVGMKALATLTKMSFDGERPAGMKVYGGGYMVHKDAPKEDLEAMKALGCKCIGEIGLGSANTVETAKQRVDWAKENGLTVTLHRGAAYLHGSNTIGPDTVVGLQPDVICHVTLGRLTKEETTLFFEKTPSFIEICRGQAGCINESIEIFRQAKARNELGRILLGNDCPSGFGIFAHGIWELITLAAGSCGVEPAVAVACATGNTAKAFKLDAGVIQAGKCADLVICDAPVGSAYKDATETIAAGVVPGVSMVMVDGVVVADGDKVNTAPARVKASR